MKSWQSASLLFGSSTADVQLDYREDTGLLFDVAQMYSCHWISMWPSGEAVQTTNKQRGNISPLKYLRSQRGKSVDVSIIYILSAVEDAIKPLLFLFYLWSWFLHARKLFNGRPPPSVMCRWRCFALESAGGGRGVDEGWGVDWTVNQASMIWRGGWIRQISPTSKDRLLRLCKKCC